MLFFRRRDTTVSQSHVTDQERCIHACLFFAFIILIVTIVLFYFAATNKVSNDQRLYYYIGAGISLAFLLLIILCTIIYVRRFYGNSLSSRPPQGILSINEYDQTRYSNRQM
jgi:hypothetical protein